MSLCKVLKSTKQKVLSYSGPGGGGNLDDREYYISQACVLWLSMYEIKTVRHQRLMEDT